MKRGVLIAIIIIVLLFISFAVVGGFIYLQITREQPIPKHSYLEIDLAGGIADNDNSAFSRADTIRDYWYHLKRAKIDRRISGIILNISYLATDFAKTEELGLLIKDFKKSGKPVYAFIEGG
ncbi:MAG: hypothetical protein GY950_01495, partial [bacterium]|nr:hypothetical protein [bacterium]